jgi:hypothetical protein
MGFTVWKHIPMNVPNMHIIMRRGQMMAVMLRHDHDVLCQ